MNAMNSFDPIREGSKEQIIAYYKKIPASVKSEIIAVEDMNLLCLSVDTGSGRQIISALVYMTKDGKWTLLHHRKADGEYIDVRFSVKEHSALQIMGGVIAKKKGQPIVIYRPVDTVLIKPKK